MRVLGCISRIIPSVTKMFDPTSLTALQSRTSLKIINKDSDWISDFGSSPESDIPPIQNLNPTVWGSHEEISLTDSVSMMDARKNSNVSSPPVQYVNTQVSQHTEESFASEETKGHSEIVYNAVSRHKFRMNGNNLLLSETAVAVLL